MTAKTKHSRPPKSLRYLSLAFTTVVSSHSYAWWHVGHAEICSTALPLLTAKADAEVRALLQGEDFGAACGWADDVRPERPETSPWHYLNVPAAVDDVNLVERPADGDVLSAIEQQGEILANHSADFEQRQEALKWVGHFVGDMHQPMHLGLAEDWGGNKYRLSIPPMEKKALRESKRDRTNMHAVWDGYLLIHWQNQHGDTPAIAPADIKVAGEPTDWANETLRVLRAPAVRYATDDRIRELSFAYMDANAAAAQQQNTIAAYRLAALLNRLLD